MQFSRKYQVRRQMRIKNFLFLSLIVALLCAVALIFFKPANQNIFVLVFLLSLSMGFVLGLPNLIRNAIRDGITFKGRYRQVERSAEPIQFWLHLLVMGALWVASLMFLGFAIFFGLGLVR